MNVTLGDKIGQMLIHGFCGTHLKQCQSFMRDMVRTNCGGVILFDKNAAQPAVPRNIISPAQTQKLITDLQNTCGHSLWVSIDQEGGAVARLKPSMGFMQTRMPSEFASSNIYHTYLYATGQAQQLQWLGINVNFFPTVDVNINSNNPIIGKLGRAFSENAAVVVEQAEAFVSRLHYHNIASCLKHFPGHGSSSTDSHLEFVDVSDFWQSSELTPYYDLLASFAIPFVMLGHVMHRDLDPVYPVSLSATTIQKLLREKLNYQGLVLTDDLQMHAIAHAYSLEESIILAINAGSDMLIFGNNIGDYQPELLRHTHDIILQAVKQKHIDPLNIDRAYQRITKMKQRYGLLA